MASVHSIPSIEEQFDFTSKAKRNLLIGGVLGIVLILVGIFLISSGGGHEAAHGAAEGHGESHGGSWMTRVWANLWLNGVYFTGMAVIGMFFISYNYLAESGWTVAFKRIPEAMPAFLPIAGAVLLITFLLGGHDLFHWTHSDLYDPNSEHFDPIIDGKKGYLNTPFFLVRLVLYFALWYYLWTVVRKASLEEDRIGGLDNYHRSFKFAVIFLVVFGVTSSTSAWDFVMSIDTHWFSTMFGWYTLASWHVTGLAFITLAVVTLREMGYLKAVNESHLHDLGKFVFAFSIFWTYVWFAQFLLIYYANMPEETIYFIERLSGHGGIFNTPFWVNLILNFVIPFLVLMPRDSKRTGILLKVACVSVILGHYIDFYNNIMPGTVGASSGIGLLEVGCFVLFFCAFIWVFATQLTKANLVPKHHPMLEESLHHDIA